mgnify:CR=1 FL=1
MGLKTDAFELLGSQANSILTHTVLKLEPKNGTPNCPRSLGFCLPVDLVSHQSNQMVILPFGLIGRWEINRSCLSKNVCTLSLPGIVPFLNFGSSFPFLSNSFMVKSSTSSVEKADAQSAHSIIQDRIVFFLAQSKLFDH